MCPFFWGHSPVACIRCSSGTCCFDGLAAERPVSFGLKLLEGEEGVESVSRDSDVTDKLMWPFGSDFTSALGLR